MRCGGARTGRQWSGSRRGFGLSPHALDAVRGCSQRRAGQAAHWDAQLAADIASLSLRMQMFTRFWCRLLDEDQVSALSDAGGWVALQDRYVHRACCLLVIL